MFGADDGSGVLPLEGTTVVELGQIVACPFAAMLLGDLGADVIKLEAPGRGDQARGTDPVPQYFDTQNRNKRSVEVNLKSEAGQAVAHRILADADVFLESTKPGRREAYAIDYDTVSALNPSIVYCSIAGFGEDSPYEHVPGWDLLIQAMSGIMSVTGQEDGPPIWSALPSGDISASMYSVTGILAALYARERGDIDGEHMEVPMLDSAISWLLARAGYTFGTGEPHPRMERHATMVPFGPFDCADETIVVGASTDALWRDLCTAIDREDMYDDERFATPAARREHRETLIAELESVLGEHDADYWIERFHDHEVPAAPIYDTLEVWEDPHVVKRELKRVMAREGRVDAQVVDNPYRFTNLATQLALAPPELGDSTDEVLRERGYSEAEIADLREDGAI